MNGNAPRADRRGRGVFRPVALISRLSGHVETMDEIEAREAIEANVPHFKSGRIG